MQAEGAGALFALLAVAVQTQFAAGWVGLERVAFLCIIGRRYSSCGAGMRLGMVTDTDKDQDRDKIMDMATPAQRVHGVLHSYNGRLQLGDCCIARVRTV